LALQAGRLGRRGNAEAKCRTKAAPILRVSLKVRMRLRMRRWEVTYDAYGLEEF